MIPILNSNSFYHYWRMGNVHCSFLLLFILFLWGISLAIIYRMFENLSGGKKLNKFAILFQKRRTGKTGIEALYIYSITVLQVKHSWKPPWDVKFHLWFLVSLIVICIEEFTIVFLRKTTLFPDLWNRMESR